MKTMFLIWFPIAVMAIAETSIDNSLCEESMFTLLPKEQIPLANTASRKNLINALVQIDSTFGITPCQYAKYKGGHGVLDEGFRGDDGENYQVADTSKVMNDKMKAMASATDQAIYGQGRNNKNKAFEAGRMIGSGAVNAGKYIGQGVAVGLNAVGNGVEDIVNYFGGSVDVNLDIFQDFEVDKFGRWVNKAGHAVGDVAKDSMFVFGGFFVGVAEAIGGPSIQGRRRVVFDVDCDFLEHEVDSMESHCHTYRYNRLQFLYPAVRDTASLADRMNINITRLNHTFYGNPMAFDQSVREIFEINRDTLYGKNGSCLEPKPKSLGGYSNSLEAGLMTNFEQSRTVLDTLWSNIMTIDQGVKNSTATVVEQYVNTTEELLHMSAGMQKGLGIDAYDALKTMGDNLSSGMVKMTEKMAKRETKIGDGTVKVQDRLVDYAHVAQKTLARITNRLDDASDILAGTPETMSKFTDTIFKGGKLVMDVANDETQRAAEETVESSITKKNQQIIDQYNSAAGRAVTSSEKDMNVSMKGFMTSTYSLTRSEVSKLSLAERMANTQLDAASRGVLSNVSNMALENAITVNNAQTAANDVSDFSTQTTRNTATSYSNVAKLFRGLRDSAEETISNSQTQVTNVITSSGKGASDQLDAISNTIKNAGSSLSDSVSDLDSHFDQLASRTAHAISDATMKARLAAANRQQLTQLQKNADEARLQASENLAGVSASQATSTWENMGNDALSQLNSIASDMTEYRSRAKSDADAALDTIGSETTDNASVQAEKGNIAARNVRELLGQIAQSSIGLTGAAGDDLGASDELSSTNLALIKGISNSLSALGPGGYTQLASLLSSLGRIDSDSADEYGGKMNSVIADSRSAIQSVVAKLIARDNQSNSLTMDQLAKVKTVLANILTHAQSGDTAFDSTDMNFVTGLNDIQQLVDSLSEGSKKTNPQFELSDQLSETSSSTRNLLASLLATMQSGERETTSDIENSLLQLMGEETDGFKTRSKSIESVLAKFLDTNFLNMKSEKESSNTLNSVSSTLNDLVKRVQSFLTDQSTAYDSLSSQFSHSIVDLQKKFATSNNSVSQNLTILNQTLGLWYSKSPQSVSDQISSYIKSLGENNMAMMDTIVQKANGVGAVGIMSGGVDFNRQSAGSLDQVSDLSNSWIKTSEEGARNLVDTRSNETEQLSDIGNSIKGIQRGIGSSTSASNPIGASSVAHDAERATNTMTGAIAAANNSFSVLTSQSGSESQFKSQLSQSQSASLVRTANDTVGSVHSLVSDSFAALDQSTEDGKINVDRISKSVADYGEKLHQKLAYSQLYSAELADNSTNNISGDKAQVEMQLMMAKRAVSQLLDSWSRYSDFQIDKFQKMNNSDATYIDLMEAKLNSTNTGHSSQLHSLQNQVDGLNGDVVHVVADYLGFANIVSSDLTGYKESVDLLNRTTEAGIDQLQESAFNYDANDDFIDKTQRSELSDAVKKFENEIDKRASQVKLSVGITNQ